MNEPKKNEQETFAKVEDVDPMFDKYLLEKYPNREYDMKKEAGDLFHQLVMANQQLEQQKALLKDIAKATMQML